MPERDLIFDLGMFDGSDTAFYLAKGFRVVAVEARHDLCSQARERFSGELCSGQLNLIEKAIWTISNEEVPFYIRSGWSSLFQQSAERDGAVSARVAVRTTTVPQLFCEFGVPHFLKCDLEGVEGIVIEQLRKEKEKPSFVSMEDPTGEIASQLLKAGYDRFQMVNQGHLDLYQPPRRSREGQYVETIFNGKCSGLFGYELNPSHWSTYDQIQSQMRFWNALRDKSVNPVYGYACKRWGKLTGRGWLIAGGWSDIHATTAETLRSVSK